MRQRCVEDNDGATMACDDGNVTMACDDGMRRWHVTMACVEDNDEATCRAHVSRTHRASTCISTWSINKPSTYISTCKCKSTANPLASSHGPSTCFSHGPSTNHQQTITSMRPIQATQTLNAIEVLVCSHPG